MGEPAVGACLDDHSQKGRDVVQTQVIVLPTGKEFLEIWSSFSSW